VADKFEEISMKRILGGMVVAAVLSGSAFAADLPSRGYTKAPMLADPASNWSGFYIGINGGCAGNRTDVSSRINDPDPDPGSFFTSKTERQGGCFGGVQAGYNYQLAPNWVAGIEVDGQFGQETSRGQLLEEFGDGSFDVLANYQQRMEHYGTARGRIGYAANLPVTGQTLLYLTGGFAWARNKLDATAFDTPVGSSAAFSDTKTLTGYAVGGGVEFAVNRNWSWKAEYLYIDFGNNAYNAFVSDDGTPFSAISATTRLHTARVGLNYRFN